MCFVWWLKGDNLKCQDRNDKILRRSSFSVRGMVPVDKVDKVSERLLTYLLFALI